MTKQESIKYISSLVTDPSRMTEGDQGSIELFRQKYPYFIPARYLLASQSHKKAAWNPQMRSSVQPYTGNWMLFFSFLTAGNWEGQSLTYGKEETKTVGDHLFVHEITIETEVAEEVVRKQGADHIPEEVHAFIAVAEVDSPIVTGSISGGGITLAEIITVNEVTEKKDEPLFIPALSQDYFLQQGVKVSDELPPKTDEPKNDRNVGDDDKSLMVMMSFSEWLLHFKNVSQTQNEELKERKALRTMWQKEKLAAAMEEENEEIPEDVFEMAVNSISNEDGPVTETLADIYIKQGKYDKAIEVYRKLSLRNPQKNVYFARKIDEILKDKQS